MKLLFVCVGNTCRSQMAEAIARDLGFTSASAGTNPGTVVAANSLIVLEEMGVNSDGLRPKSVDEIETEGWDKIISMGCGVHCPMLPIAEDWELEDPVGQPLEVYRNTRDEIKRRLDMLKNDS